MNENNYCFLSKKKLEQIQNKIKNNEDVLILGVESSCDETSVSIVKNGRQILSNIIATQIPIHKKFGGVVPEVASRNHILVIDKVLKEALDVAKCDLSSIDAVAVTYGAGLIGALLVGVNFAKSLAYALQVPLIAVSHVEGHICANYLSHQKLKPPFLCLMVSGGHTAILKIDSYTSHKLIGTTIDDATGEAFDKVARVLGLGYPGGVEVDKLARQGEANIQFIKNNSLKSSFDFSFSGIKTAVINYVHNLKQISKQDLTDKQKADICASFQKFVIDELTSKSLRACKTFNLNKLVIAGGVGANSGLRKKFDEIQKQENIEIFYPNLDLCTDNAGMIASAGYFQIKDNIGIANLNLTAKPTINL